MKIQTKILIGTALALITVLPLMSVITANSDYNETYTSDYRIWDGSREFIMEHPSRNWRHEIAIWFFRDAQIVTVEGTVTAHAGHVLILTRDEGERLNIVLPGAWNVDSQVVRLPEIFKQGYISIGDKVTIQALQRTATNKNNVTVTGFLGYEIADEMNGSHLYAVLPFNIEE